jgi:hypothetical protein
MNPDTHDSTQDTTAHINRVRQLLTECEAELARRGHAHDLSKLEEPEKSAFDRLKALSLSGMAYGSDEYRACLRAEQPSINHHYAANSHHPEHYRNGVDGMDIFDVIEMLMDWKAASERMVNGGDIRKSLEINKTRFSISPQLESILQNTINSMGW